MKKILILHGPNLNLLGVREPEVYGSMTLAELNDALQRTAFESGFELIISQSNVEGELVNSLQEYGFSAHGIVFNPGGYTHTSVALRDAVSAIASPVIEVHLSHPDAREDFRKPSLLREACFGSISGLGAESYIAALRFFIEKQP
ncbi:MAG: type II 3-dehydroquinate dehydratase [Flavobacteriales bacterium]|nr:type II 3-dehydroquinate dehydratase [Flavobacteriales bacterium]